MSKPGRNDPCYCGSGKKYKKCHMAADKAAEAERRELADAGQWLRRDFLRFAREERFAGAFAVALPLYWDNYYTFENADEMSENEAIRFFDWFFFDYQHEDEPRLVDVYNKERRRDLSQSQQQLLDLWLKAPPAGAYEMLDYKGQMLQLKDFLTGETFELYEPSGHGLVEPGDLLLGRPVEINDRLEFTTLAAYLPQDEIADLGDKLEEARAAGAERYPEAGHEEFLRRNGHLIIHHALAQAELKGRPPVAAQNQSRPDKKLVRRAAKSLRDLQERLGST
ncbi:MAG: YecA family protein [Candidatus Promineifilaceae bacterium]